MNFLKEFFYHCGMGGNSATFADNSICCQQIRIKLYEGCDISFNKNPSIFMLIGIAIRMDPRINNSPFLAVARYYTPYGQL